MEICGGFGNKEAREYLRKIIRRHKPYIVGIIEPKQTPDKISNFSQKINYDSFMHFHPNNSHIWIFWRQDIQVTMIEAGEQYATARVDGTNAIYLTLVYGKWNRADRIPMWEYLKAAHDTPYPWIVGGDFNTILRASEKKGGLDPDIGSMQDFQECIIAANLSEVPFEGREFTWSNNQSGGRRIWQRLDRVLVNGDAVTQFPELKVSHLHRMISDHSPLLVSIAQENPHKSRFVFQKMWLEHPQFAALVEEVWRSDVRGSPSSRFAEKLSRVQQKLKKWNWESFGDLNRKIEQLNTKVATLENQLHQHWSEHVDKELDNCHQELRQSLKWEADLYYQKTRARWFQDGDRNTKFFHALIRERRRLHQITIQEANGDLLTDPKLIAQRAAEYFGSIFTASPYIMHEQLFQGYPAVVSHEMNVKLTSISEEHEVCGP